ncbi:hypothetical protein C8R47DRAFT_1207138 [Mycena vitilis]|nr:hypothetical protein C8R47DRAFT_1212828 [Mycena vitilis]KAJ6513849.1 hypothetical protein C8R47DRAFT_1207138 [Mycena vitilis]
MPSKADIQSTILELRTAFDRMEEENKSLPFLKEVLQPADLRRFLAGMANDEVVNMYVAVLQHSPGSDQPNGRHFGSMFGLPPPSRKFKIMSSFFYDKLKELLAAQNPQTGSEVKAKTLEKTMIRWFKQADFNLLTNFLIPTNEPRQIHWFLIEIDYRQTSISIYDSLPSEAFSSALEIIAKSKYSLPLALAVLATQLIFKASQEVLQPVSRDWRLQTVPIPIQDNGIDCGFYMIMVALHLMHLGQVHHPDCPPILNISPTTMQQTRAILAATLIAWCTLNPPEMAQESKQMSQESKLLEEESEVQVDLAAISKEKPGLVKAALPEAATTGREPLEELPQISYSPVPSSVDGEADMDSGAEAKMASEEMHVSCCTRYNF